MFKFPLYDPLLPIPHSFNKEWDEMVSDLFNRDPGFPPYNLIEEDGKIVLEYALAGYTKDDLDIKVVGNALKIIGNAKKDIDENVKEIPDKFIKKGIAARYFNVSWKIADNISADDIKCSLKDGLLRVEISVPEKERGEIRLEIK